MQAILIVAFLSLACVANAIPVNLVENIKGLEAISFAGGQPISLDNIQGDVADDQVDVVSVIQQRLNTYFTDLGNACCEYSACSGQICRRSCPASCWVTGWQVAPTMSIQNFQILGDNPATYTPTLIVPQNYTNLSNNVSTSAKFTYSQSFTDTVTVTNSQTLTMSVTVEEKVEVKVFSEDVTIGFSYSTTSSESVTNSSTKTWSIQFGPTPVPPCSGLFVECYILAANFNPTFSAKYVVQGTPTDDCNGNWHWDPIPLNSFAGYDICLTNCNPTVCPNPPINFDNSITVTGIWNGILGAEVLCDAKPYPFPPDQCGNS
jgi:hypothetical protein